MIYVGYISGKYYTKEEAKEVSECCFVHPGNVLNDIIKGDIESYRMHKFLYECQKCKSCKKYSEIKNKDDLYEKR